MGPQLLGHVISLVGHAATGPELFIATVHQVSFMTAALVQSVCNKIRNLKLKSFARESVLKMGELMVQKIKQIECSGSTPNDLLFLVVKPFATSTQETL